MRYLPLFCVLALSGCFIRYVPVDSPRPLIDVADIQRPGMEPLIDELPLLSDPAQQSVSDLADYARSLRGMIDAYNRLATEHNARLSDD